MIRKLIISFCIYLIGTQLASAQPPGAQRGRQLNSAGNPGLTYDSQGRPMKKNAAGNDSLQRRDRYADSITIFFKYYDSSKIRKIDSSINDFTTRFPLPAHYYTLGNYGTAANSFLFNPLMKPGFDAGFHQYDVYGFQLANTRLFQTTRPYTELAYVLGSKAEQLINVLHTQNKKTNFNFSVEFQFSNAPGNLKNQNASVNNFRFVSQYQTLNKKYSAQLIYFTNKISASENGGLQNEKNLDSLALNDPYELETRMGKSGTARRNPFNTTVNTGNQYQQSNLHFLHYFDLGTRDSLVTDSVTYRLFFPRLRIQHLFSFQNASYHFFDFYPDSSNYKRFFNFDLPNDSLSYKDAYQLLTNEFSLVSFPEKNNLAQFLKAGVGLQNIHGNFDSSKEVRLNNLYLVGEYRNRTRNFIWDLEATFKYYLTGYYAGDYLAFLSMKRLLGNRLGSMSLGFQNVNRSPSFLLNTLSSFPVNNRMGFGKENTLKFFAVYEHPKLGFRFTGDYFVVNNHLYFDSFFSAKQYPRLFNLIHLSAEKKIRLTKYWNWYLEIHAQKAMGNPPINIPFLYTRNRIAFEGNFSVNLFLSSGLEIKYASSYQPSGYSPMTGQFYYQNTFVANNRPQVDFFFHFRIKSFKGFFRLENLNALDPGNGFSFTKPNFSVHHYPSPGLWTRFGIWWNFVN